MHPFDNKLKSLGITLPNASAPLANYVPVVAVGKRLIISGQLPMVDGKPLCLGRLGDEIDVDKGVDAARTCALNILAQVYGFCHSFEPIDRLLRLGVFIASTPDFTDQPKVANGASDFMASVMGDRGRHARAAVGVACLPLGVPVEIEAEFSLL